MNRHLTPDVCVVGGGSAGLVVAAGAAQLGLDTVLIERAEMGGDCLNFGCVPSKALIAAAKAAQAQRSGAAFGIAPVEPQIDFARVMDHVTETIAAIAPNDSVERFEKLGVRVLQEEARFVGRTELQAGPHRIRSKRIVLATGSRPTLPPIAGLAETPHFTNETIFANRTLPTHLLVIGGGPIGIEMAQAFRRLGAQVTVLEAATLLAKDDPELAALVVARLRAEGVDLREGAKIERVERTLAGVAALLSDGTRIAGSHLLVAAGRSPTVEGLDLEKAAIAYTRHGITVNAALRTSNRHVWAIGDCNGLYAFTHMAGYEASLFIRGALFRAPAKLDPAIVPWATYSDPELAQVGLGEREARQKHGDGIRVLRWSFAENDRAHTERATEGLVKAITNARGRILGATIVGPQAGELIQPWCLAISRRLKISALASFVPPYPTLGEAGKRAAGSYFTETLFGPRTQRLVRFLSRLPVW
ncbi:MAG: FAD-dependent oxidoreductase [Reyranella sp.]|uniref:dihydrolipoyl dehydrogenase family protein n=1 Tax=Reyranella sp. TaxID=1929291 RepID=UPI001ACC6F62|nr:FAD-dependent oxidoreductase [Reyranella sp.]MBN9538533.1 FAD-dependent oxidoreductase [Alphaproteobacteria bacterium]MBR2817367.1 FAD-dependent oxidoreductase [Reyranella sp.]